MSPHTQARPHTHAHTYTLTHTHTHANNLSVHLSCCDQPSPQACSLQAWAGAPVAQNIHILVNEIKQKQTKQERRLAQSASCTRLQTTARACSWLILRTAQTAPPPPPARKISTGNQQTHKQRAHTQTQTLDFLTPSAIASNTFPRISLRSIHTFSPLAINSSASACPSSLLAQQ